MHCTAPAGEHHNKEGRQAPIDPPTGRRLAKISTNQPNTPRRSSCCDCPQSTAIDAAAAETNATELTCAPVEPVGNVCGPSDRNEEFLGLFCLLSAEKRTKAHQKHRKQGGC